MTWQAERGSEWEEVNKISSLEMMKWKNKEGDGFLARGVENSNQKWVIRVVNHQIEMSVD